MNAPFPVPPDRIRRARRRISRRFTITLVTLIGLVIIGISGCRLLEGMNVINHHHSGLWRGAAPGASGTPIYHRLNHRRREHRGLCVGERGAVRGVGRLANLFAGTKAAAYAGKIERPHRGVRVGAAGIDRTRGLVAYAGTDAENVYIVLTARGLRLELSIIARANYEESEAKLLRAGRRMVTIVETASLANKTLAEGQPGTSMSLASPDTRSSK